MSSSTPVSTRRARVASRWALRLLMAHPPARRRSQSHLTVNWPGHYLVDLRPARIVVRGVPASGASIGAVDVLTSLPAFVLAVLLISASPGPAMALIFRRAALRGLRGAVPTVLGLEFGLYLWALFAGVGFAALVAASEVAYLVLRVVGAGVLLVLGFRALRTAWRDRTPAAEPPAAATPGRRRWWASFA